MLGHNNIVLLFALSLLQTGAARPKPVRHFARPAGVVAVDAPLHEILNGYVKWLKHHPEAIPHAQPLIPKTPGLDASPSQDVASPLVIRIPSVALYSPSGISVYYDTNSDKNAAFLRALPSGTGDARQANTGAAEVTLREAIEMFAELKPYEGALLAEKRYTILALTCADNAGWGTRCKNQNEVIDQLVRVNRLGIGVIHVRVHND